MPELVQSCGRGRNGRTRFSYRDESGEPSYTQLDERASWFYEAVGVTIGMMGRTVGAGQAYLESQKDSTGSWLDGGKNYQLHIPPYAPVAQFWSFTVNDNEVAA